MEHGAVERLLEQYDDPIHAEAPPGWDWQVAEARFAGLARAVQERLGFRGGLEVGPAIQDASFHGQLHLPRRLITTNRDVAVRASNFGDLATIYDDDTVVHPDALATIVATLEEHGYTYVPSGILQKPYAGPNSGVGGISTWQHRYFDWI